MITNVLLKMRFFGFISLLCCLYACDAAPTFEEAILTEATFEYHIVGGHHQTFSWADLEPRDQAQCVTWLADAPMDGGVCLTTYAPNVVIRTKQFNVNFTGDLAVCNVALPSGNWRQVTRAQTEADNRLCATLERTRKRLFPTTPQAE